MEKEKMIVKTAIELVDAVFGSEKVQTFLCGKYSDGTPRSLPDALNDELYSPQQKKNKNKNDKKKKKKNKKKGKKKKNKTHDYYFEL